MKVLSLFVGLYLLSILYFVPVSLAQDEVMLMPVPQEDTQSPQITVVSPEKDTVVATKFNLEMKVTNFELTAKPIESPTVGVVAIYVDGKFFTNSASNSAQLTIPKAGTHHIEVELTHVDRSPIVPRVADSFYIHVQKKTPYLQVKDLRAEGFLYVDKPTLAIDYIPASFEDKSKYYQVFIDGEVDGTSKDLEDTSKYTINNALTAGKHSLRLALYSDNDRPYTPTVEYQVPFNYSADRPTIEEIVMEQQIDSSQPLHFEVMATNFMIGKDGYVDVFAEGVHHYLSQASGDLPHLSVGNQKVAFTLYDRNGYLLNPNTSIQKIVSVTGAKNNTKSINSFLPSGTFFAPSDGSGPRWGFIMLGAIEAIAIIVFGILLLKHEKDK